MKLHAKNLALAAGANRNEVEIIAKEMLQGKNISAGKAEELLRELRDKSQKEANVGVLSSSSPS
jgi:hydroxymethylglutaryl-CoA reductase